MHTDLWYRVQHKQSWRWTLSFLASVLAHILLLLLLFGILFSANTPTPKQKLPKMLDVVLLKKLLQQQKPPPDKVDALANIDAVGGNKSHDKLTRDAQSSVQLQQQVQRWEQQQKQPAVIPQQKYQSRIQKTLKKPVAQAKKIIPPPKPIVPTLAVPDLRFSLADANRVAQNTQRARQRASSNEREAEISMNTRRAKYVPYVHELVRQLEEQWRPIEIDYNNYREEDRQVYMRITIEADGSLGGINMLRPSILEGLNASALRAVRDAAPFRTLPSTWGLDRAHFRLIFEVVEDRFIFR